MHGSSVSHVLKRSALVFVRRMKLGLAALLSSGPVSWVVDRLFPRRVLSHGLWLGRGSSAFTPRTKAMILFRLYERAEIGLVNRGLPEDADIVELGASLGVVSSHLANKLGAGRRLICVEANSELESIWTDVVGRRPGVTLLNAAISGELNGVSRFGIAADPLLSRLSTRDCEERTLEVKSVTLSHLLSVNEFSDFFLVSDIEGAEAFFILGDDRDALSTCTGMIIELHDVHLDTRTVAWQDLRECLISEHGFRVVAEHGPVVMFDRSFS